MIPLSNERTNENKAGPVSEPSKQTGSLDGRCVEKKENFFSRNRHLIIGGIIFALGLALIAGGIPLCLVNPVLGGITIAAGAALTSGVILTIGALWLLIVSFRSPHRC